MLLILTSPNSFYHEPVGLFQATVAACNYFSVCRCLSTITDRALVSLSRFSRDRKSPERRGEGGGEVHRCRHQQEHETGPESFNTRQAVSQSKCNGFSFTGENVVDAVGGGILNAVIFR